MAIFYCDDNESQIKHNLGLELPQPNRECFFCFVLFCFVFCFVLGFLFLFLFVCLFVYWAYFKQRAS